MMFRRKTEGLVKHFVKRIRECYLYLRVLVAEKVAKTAAKSYMHRADQYPVHCFKDRWIRFKIRMGGRKLFAQAAICRYARRKGTYKNL